MFAQEMKFRFVIVKNERPFEFLVTPGTPWEDVQSALADFVEDFKALEIEIKAKEAAAATPVVDDTVPVEVVSEAPQGE